MVHFYNLFIKLYFFAIRLASLWNKKAAAWIEGRKDLFPYLEKNIAATDQLIWVHCSSAGELEQGKPLMEALKNTYPAKKILVTFFSPSGYTVAKNYAFADLVTFLPLDTRENAARFFKLVNPELVIFVKYEFWYHHLSVAAFHHVPLLLVSAVFRSNQAFFKNYGAFFRQMLFLFRHIFVQDQASLRLLQSAGISHCSISGDTRFDRVMKITENHLPLPFIEEFVSGEKVIVAGSTWPGDEAVLAQYLKQQKSVKLIIAPHEIKTGHIASLQSLFPVSILYSQISKQPSSGSTVLQKAQTLIIDSVGLLSLLYRYATITYVGGGFTSDGIHNILEAAVWGKPVLFGPNYRKYREAIEMIEKGGAISFQTAENLKNIADDLFSNADRLQGAGLNARNYVQENTGATGKIMQVIQEKRLLIN